MTNDLTDPPRTEEAVRRPFRRRAALIALGVVAAGAVVLARLDQAPAPSATQLSAFTVSPPAGVTVTYRADGGELLSDGSMILPLDAYDAYATASDEHAVFEAATHIEQSCMHAQGLTLPTGWGGNYLPTPAPPLIYYGVNTMTDARQFGYRMPGSASAPSAQPEVPQTVVHAFNGCAGKAYLMLDITQANDAGSTLENLRSHTLDQVFADPRLRDANAAWSTCMKAAGYDYPNPLAPQHDRSLLGRGLPVPKGATLPPPSPYEKHAAETDVTCKAKTDYLQTFTMLWAGYQRQAITKSTAQLGHVLSDWSTVLQLARAHQTP
ncbi:hypothetical protein [Streptacidiphilus anmyonensis]|uniref:hypothetical protein n=1 Tax=Streptacidiphilus anmyonensis TaxID=405782 RepID=UPI0005A6CD6E|nr:hypothetical protein [Streptacidiphilus anmyonensis]